MRVLVKIMKEISVNWRESKQHACVLMEMMEEKWKKYVSGKRGDKYMNEDSAYVRVRRVFYS